MRSQRFDDLEPRDHALGLGEAQESHVDGWLERCQRVVGLPRLLGVFLLGALDAGASLPVGNAGPLEALIAPSLRLIEDIRREDGLSRHLFHLRFSAAM